MYFQSDVKMIAVVVVAIAKLILIGVQIWFLIKSREVRDSRSHQNSHGIKLFTFDSKRDRYGSRFYRIKYENLRGSSYDVRLKRSSDEFKLRFLAKLVDPPIK